jgi:biotin carboxyl carrier protein
VSEHNTTSQLALEGGTYETQLTKKYRLRKPYEKDDPRIIKAVIPGVIERIDTTVGAKVKKGVPLMILEAMKMHNRIASPFDGVVKAIRVAAGEKVAKGQVLIEIE